jgi:uncharacterized membrane protein YkvA (DUF1232 family)
MPNRIPFALRRFMGRAEELIKSQSETQRLLHDAQEKAQHHRHSLEKIREQLKALIRMIQAWRNGEYHELPLRTVVVVVAAILYFVTPIDLIPDFIPFTGFLDDATVIALVFKSIRNQVQAFMLWESARQTVDNEEEEAQTHEAEA